MNSEARVVNNWDAYRYFLALHRQASLKAAADRLGVNQTTVARNIAALEAEVGVKLFQKRSDGFFLTAAGTRILEALERVEEELLGVERRVRGEDERVSGVVRIALPGALSSFWLIPRLSALRKSAPALELELLTGPEVLNLSRREADLAVRFVRPTQQDLYVKKAGEIRLGVYTARRAGRLGEGARASESAGKRRLDPWVGLFPGATSDAEAALLKQVGAPTRAGVRSAAWTSVYHALRAGLGSGVLPSFMAEADDELMWVKGTPEARVPLWLVVHPEIRGSRRVQRVMDFLSAELQKSFG